MELRELTLQEKEKEEEITLEKEITTLSNHFKSTKLSDETEQSLDTIDTDSHHSTTIIKSFNSTSSNEEEETDTPYFRRSFLSQNICMFDELIKLIVIGQKKVGKTLFIHNISNEIPSIDEYTPTLSLDITKTIKTISNKKVKIELWDTCDHIINSDVIKTYYKMAGGFVIVINNETDMEFIMNKIEIIQNTIKRDIHYLIIYNNPLINNAYCFDGDDVNELEQKLPQCIYEYIKKIMQSYLITFMIANLKNVKMIQQKSFVNFVNELIRMKSMNKFKSVSF